MKLIIQIPCYNEAEQIADGVDIRAQTVGPGKVGVVEHPRVLNVLAGVDHGTRRRAHAGCDLMVGEGYP